jgi:hypothetical protein
MSLEDYYQERKAGAYATILRQYLEKCKEVERLKEQVKVMGKQRYAAKGLLSRAYQSAYNIVRRIKTLLPG